MLRSPEPRSSRARLAAAALLPALALAASGLGSPGASAVSAPAPAVAAPRLAEPPARAAWIEGVVVDRAERTVLDVVVEAVPTTGGEPVATALTYAGTNVHGDEVEGFYRLEVPAGRYHLRFSSAEGAADPFRTAWLVDGRDRRQAVAVEARDVTWLADQTMTLVRKADVSTSAELSASRVRKGRRAGVTVAVTSPDVVPVTGKVSITVDGRRTGTATLGHRDHGEVEEELPPLGIGTHEVAVRYLGTGFAKAGRTVTLTLKVVRRR